MKASIQTETNSRPLLSFVVPAYNEEFELGRSLDAIQTAASGHDYEIIVVDDASTDQTAAIAKNFGALVIPINRRQIAAARNAGAAVSRGEILFFVDADTRINPRHVNGALEALQSGFSGGSALVEPDGKIPRSGRIFLRIFSWIYFGAKLGAGAFLFTTRKNYDAVGGLDERYFAGEEVWFSIALKKLGPFKILKEPIQTSGRKLRMHPPYRLWWQLARLTLGGVRLARKREGLDLWYDGKREGEGNP